MQHSRFITKIGGICLAVLLALSCQKDKFEKSGQYTLPTEQLNPNQQIYGDWEKVTSGYTNIEQLSADNANLYFICQSSGTSKIIGLNTQDVSTELYAFPQTMYSITDLCLFNNNLYYSSAFNPLLSKLNLTTFQNTTFPITGSLEDINDLLVAGDYLYFCGYFNAGSFAQSPYLDCINTSDVAQGTHPTSEAYTGMFTDENNTLYAFKSDQIVKWNGQWTTVSSGLPYMFSGAMRNDTMFYTGANGTWSNYQPQVRRRVSGLGSISLNLSVSTSVNGGAVKVCSLNGEIYAYGNGLSYNGSYSNVFRLTGNSWTSDAVIHEKVNDLEYFNGHLYAATDDGLYKL